MRLVRYIDKESNMLEIYVSSCKRLIIKTGDYSIMLNKRDVESLINDLRDVVDELKEEK